MSARGAVFTNTLTLTGHCDDGRFVLELTPGQTLDDTAESVGWDGNLLCLIQRWSAIPHNPGALRTNSLAYVEPNVFSRYASMPLQAVLIAFADSNLVSKLGQGQLPVILGWKRVYPEENNTYKVTHPAAGATEITASSPGLELGRTGLVPIGGLEQGFTRWTHRSSFTLADQPDGPGSLAIEYNRFSPVNGKLVQNRAVKGRITFQRENQPVAAFRPVITESSLTVMDYSCRYDIFQWTKGLSYWSCQYKLDRRGWNFDTNYIMSQVAQLKGNLAAMNGYPKALSDKANTLAVYAPVPVWGSQRIITICVLIAFSVFSAVAFWMGSRGELGMEKQQKATTKT